MPLEARKEGGQESHTRGEYYIEELVSCRASNNSCCLGDGRTLLVCHILCVTSDYQLIIKIHSKDTYFCGQIECFPINTSGWGW